MRATKEGLQNTIRQFQTLPWEKRIDCFKQNEDLTVQVFERGIIAGSAAILLRQSFTMLFEDHPHAVERHQVRALYDGKTHKLHVEIPGDLITKKGEERIQGIDFATETHVLESVISMIRVANDRRNSIYSDEKNIKSLLGNRETKRRPQYLSELLPPPALEVGFKHDNYMTNLLEGRRDVLGDILCPLTMHPHLTNVFLLHSQADSDTINPMEMFYKIYTILQNDESLGTTVTKKDGYRFKDWVRHASLRYVSKKLLDLDGENPRTMLPPSDKSDFTLYVVPSDTAASETFKNFQLARIQWRRP